MALNKFLRIIGICLVQTSLLFAFVVKHEDASTESLIAHTAESTSSERTRQHISRNGTEDSTASLVFSSNFQERTAEIQLQQSEQPIISSNGVVHTAHKRSACSEPSALDLDVKIQLFRSGFVTTEEPTGAFEPGVDSLQWLRNTGFPVFWEGEDCRGYPSDLLTVFPPTSSNRSAACPWRLVRNSDPNRYPRDLLYAQCACTKCALLPIDFFSLVNDCRPVLRDEHMLRKTDECVEGKYVYKPVLEPIPVACVCVRPHVSISDMDQN